MEHNPLIRLVLLLMGAMTLRDRWPVLMSIGLVGGFLAAAIVGDASDGVTVVTTEAFGWILVIDGVAAFASGMAARSHTSQFDMVRSFGLVLLIVDLPWRNDLANSFFFGLAFLIDGATRMFTASLMRFRGWTLVACGSALELCLAALAFASWPVPYSKTVPFCVGVLLLLAGWTALRLALALRRLPRDGSILALPTFGRQCWYSHAGGVSHAPGLPTDAEGPPLMLYVWTPLGSAEDPVRRPLADRWIAAVGRKGQISTGHAALGLEPDLYISHYPETEQNRSQSDFIRQLRATADNDVPGRFLPSYRHEVETWFEADAQVVFHRFDAARLRAHWAAYSQDTTYNLTRRNCSVSVAVALDAAMEGVCGGGPLWHHIPRLLSSPDLWLAAAVRHRADAMTWTPGLILDYARALHRVVEPPSVGWVLRLKGALWRLRRIWTAPRIAGAQSA